MKKKIERTQKTIYICEACNEQYNSKYDAVYCEESHKCKHEKIKFYYDYDNCSINKKCEICHTIINKFIIYSLLLNNLEECCKFFNKLKNKK